MQPTIDHRKTTQRRLITSGYFFGNRLWLIGPTAMIPLLQGGDSGSTPLSTIMKHEDHCKKSLEMFGEDGAEYHHWIDQYFKEEGWTHRNLLHNQEGVEMGVKKFGEIARKHLVQHLIDDERYFPEDCKKAFEEDDAICGTGVNG